MEDQHRNLLDIYLVAKVGSCHLLELCCYHHDMEEHEDRNHLDSFLRSVIRCEL